jgi:3-oxoacyl-[acyl-carrier protein] reductase
MTHNVVVTGASRGIGRAIALRLHQDGYQVIGVARADAAAMASQLPIAFRRFDLGEIDKIAAFVRGLRREFGPIWGLVNNAAIGTSGILATMHDQAIERLIRINLLSPLVVSKYVVRGMLADSTGGRIVNIASIAAFGGYRGLVPYGATKAGLVAATRSLAREIGPANITVNTIAPGFIDTDMTEGMDAEQRQRVILRSPLRRLVRPEDIAAAVAHLMSDEAKNITGTVLTVDAGSTA